MLWTTQELADPRCNRAEVAASIEARVLVACSPARRVQPREGEHALRGERSVSVHCVSSKLLVCDRVCGSMAHPAQRVCK